MDVDAKSGYSFVVSVGWIVIVAISATRSDAASDIGDGYAACHTETSTQAGNTPVER